jgi:hypothetical protein
MKLHASTAVPTGLGALFGLLAGLSLVALGEIDMQGSINLGNIVQAATTLLVGVAVAAYLQPQTTTQRKEKEIVFAHFDSALNALAAFEHAVHNGVLLDINAQLKKVSGTCSAVNELLRELDFNAEVLSHSNVSDLLRQLRALATDTPIERNHIPAPADVAIVDGRIKYSDARSALITTKIQFIRMRLLRAQIAVNKA